MNDQEFQIGKLVHQRYLKTLEFVVLLFTGIIVGIMFYKPDSNSWITSSNQLVISLYVFLLGVVLFYWLTNRISELELKLGWKERDEVGRVIYEAANAGVLIVVLAAIGIMYFIAIFLLFRESISTFLASLILSFITIDILNEKGFFHRFK